MRRIMVLVTVALVMAVLMALSALPVMAVNSGNQPPGPPFESGSPNTEGARAFHCETIGAKGASVTNKNGQPTRCR
jgi:NADH:ubiquinone oxidoreductase subunit 3 (subunit A)